MKIKAQFTPDPKLKPMDQVCQVLLDHHSVLINEQSFIQWIIRFIRCFNTMRHLHDKGVWC